MSGTFPESPAPNSITITSVRPTLVSVTHSLKRQARSRGGQRWLIEAGYPRMSRSTFAPVWAFANAQKGQFETFSYKPPIYKDSTGTASGTLAINNASGYSAGDSTLTVDGITGTLKAGDFIKFAGHDKVYTITNDATTALNIEPPLLTSVADDEVVIYNDVPFTVAFGADQQELSMSVDQMIDYAISLVEVV
jgi:hypothetical protein